MFREYLRMLADTNGFGPGEWLMGPGMRFGSWRKWWSGNGTRTSPHNGLDLRIYREASGREVYLDGRDIVPVCRDGEVINIVKDFLGHSVFVMHGKDANGAALVSAYGHIVPAEGLLPGVRLTRGGTIGKLSDYIGMPVPPHLHISLIESGLSDLRGLGWEELGTSDSIRFLDPIGN